MTSVKQLEPAGTLPPGVRGATGADGPQPIDFRNATECVIGHVTAEMMLYSCSHSLDM